MIRDSEFCIIGLVLSLGNNVESLGRGGYMTAMQVIELGLPINIEVHFRWFCN